MQIYQDAPVKLDIKAYKQALYRTLYEHVLHNLMPHPHNPVISHNTQSSSSYFLSRFSNFYLVQL